MPYPKCFDHYLQYRMWMEADLITIDRGRKKVPGLPCMDCTAGYQKTMIAEGRCEHPDVVFRRNDQGEVVGHVPPQPGEATIHLVGVTKSSKNRWAARVWRDGRQTLVGYFDSEEEAAEAYRKEKGLVAA